MVKREGGGYDGTLPERPVQRSRQKPELVEQTDDGASQSADSLRALMEELRKALVWLAARRPYSCLYLYVSLSFFLRIHIHTQICIYV